MNAATERSRSIHRLADLIRNIRVAMLVTTSPSGSLHGRPMIALQDLRDDCLWFFVHADDPKVREVARDPRVNVSFADAAASRFVSISGRAALVEDRSKLQELWEPSLRTWFPHELKETGLALLQVEIEQAEFWDEASRSMAFIGGLLKSFVTGEPEAPAGHRKIDLTAAAH